LAWVIEVATGVRRETAGGYLRPAGIALRRPGGLGRKPPVKAAIEEPTGSDRSKPAIEVITGFFPEASLPKQVGMRPSGASGGYREMIELELSRDRNATGIYQDLGRPVRVCNQLSERSAIRTQGCAEPYRRKLV
jgi:hypothetical protein